MKIERTGPESPPAVSRVPATQSRVAPAPSGAGRRIDRVEISEAGRAASGEHAAAQLSDILPIAADAPDRLDQIRARVKAGYYLEEQVRIVEAREIVIRGELHF
jgi:hypothetical protein